MAQQEMQIAGRRVGFVADNLPVKSLKLDPNNPRLHYLVSIAGGKATDKELHDMLWERDSVKELAESIYQNGGLLEPVIVRGEGLVVEGNCRTVALRELKKKYPQDGRFQTARANVYDGKMEDEQLQVLLADMHVAGKSPWDAYEQARCVKILKDQYGKPYDWLTSHLRMRRAKIAQLLKAYDLTEAFLKKDPDPKHVRKFSVFEEVAKRKVLLQRFDEPEFVARFHRWLEEGKISDHKQVRDLAEILANPEAINALDKKGYAAAYEVLEAANPSRTSSLYATIKETTERLRKAPLDEIQQLQSGNVQRIRMVRELYRAIQDIATQAQLKL